MTKKNKLDIAIETGVKPDCFGVLGTESRECPNKCPWYSECMQEKAVKIMRKQGVNI